MVAATLTATSTPLSNCVSPRTLMISSEFIALTL